MEKEYMVEKLGTQEMDNYMQLFDSMIGPIHPERKVREAFIALLMDGKTEAEARYIVNEALKIVQGRISSHNSMSKE